METPDHQDSGRLKFTDLTFETVLMKVNFFESKNSKVKFKFTTSSSKSYLSAISDFWKSLSFVFKVRFESESQFWKAGWEVTFMKVKTERMWIRFIAFTSWESGKSYLYHESKIGEFEPNQCSATPNNSQSVSNLLECEIDQSISHLIRHRADTGKLLKDQESIHRIYNILHFSLR